MARGLPPARGSGAGELRVALLDERGQAFPGVRAREELTERFAFRGEVVLVVAAERAVRELLHRPERDGALCGEESCRLARLVQHGIVHAVDEPDARGFVRSHQTAREDQLLGDTEAAHARESLRATPARDDSEIHLGLTELRAARRVAK